MSKKKPEDQKRRPGNKSKYGSHVQPYLKNIMYWTRDGMTQEVIAKKLGVTPQTFCTYKEKYPELFESLKNGAQDIVYAVESALLKGAMGYKYNEVSVTEKEIEISDKDAAALGVEKCSMVTEKTTRNTTKQVQGNAVSQQFWLINRSEKWQSTSKIELSGVNGEPIEVMTGADRKARIKELEEKKEKRKERKKQPKQNKILNP